MVKKEAPRERIEEIKPVFFMTLEKINEKPCYFCGSFDSYRDRAGGADSKGNIHKATESEPSEPGDFMQHENRYIKDIGTVAVFECAKCHHLMFFRSHYEESIFW